MIKLVIEGEPIAKTRHRCGCRGKYPVAYDPQIKSDMEPMRKLLLAKWNKMFEVPGSQDAKEASLIAQGSSFLVQMRFYMAVPRSLNVGLANLKFWGITPCNEKPDFDNLSKFYSDCLTGIVWPDDKMVSWALIQKVRYSKNPRTEIIIMSKKDLTLDDRTLSVFKAFSPDEMKEFISQTIKLKDFMEKNETYFSDTTHIGTENFFSEASMLLGNFATTFSDKLKKIAKTVG